MTKEELEELKRLLGKYIEREADRGTYEDRFFVDTCHECGGILRMLEALDEDLVAASVNQSSGS